MPKAVDIQRTEQQKNGSPVTKTATISADGPATVNMGEPGRCPAWLRVDHLLGEWGIPAGSPAGREQFAGHMEARRRAEGAGDYAPQGWCLGSEAFREELLMAVTHLASPAHAGEELRQSAEAKAQRILQEELAHLGWGAQALVLVVQPNLPTTSGCTGTGLERQIARAIVGELA